MAIPSGIVVESHFRFSGWIIGRSLTILFCLCCLQNSVVLSQLVVMVELGNCLSQKTISEIQIVLCCFFFGFTYVSVLKSLLSMWFLLIWFVSDSSLALFCWYLRWVKSKQICGIWKCMALLLVGSSCPPYFSIRLEHLWKTLLKVIYQTKRKVLYRINISFVQHDTQNKI